MITIARPEAAAAVKALHGVNLGPISQFYAYDLSPHYQRLGIPSVRTHDCNRSAADVVDLHCIFPNPQANPDDPANYHFTLTDDYLAAIRNAGCDIYFRLGESIEGRKPRKYFVTAGRWKPETIAKVCLNIARHYNEGWADGHEWGITQWQFWNEPSNCWILPVEQRPCWMGSVEEFYTLYGAVARAFKAHNPEWKIGLAGYGRPDFIFPEGHPLFHPENPWRFISDIANAGPIDSISWHQYGASWEDLAKTTREVRAVLDANGLSHAENHMTEWYYLPRVEDESGSYTYFHTRSDATAERRIRMANLMHSERGAAYFFGALARLQSEALDLAHLYTGINHGALGLFCPLGDPYPCLQGLEAFSWFVGKPRLSACGGEFDRVTALAALDGPGVMIGVAHLHATAKVQEIFVNLPATHQWEAEQFGPSGWRPISVTAERLGGGEHLRFPLQSHGITVLRGVPQPDPAPNPAR